MTKLRELRSQIARLHARRQTARLVIGYAAIVLAVLWLLLTLYLLDWTFELTRLQRLLAMALCAGGLTWVYRTFTRPWLHERETELDVALLVEREQNIDSDLVAALQFETPEAKSWGSSQLEGAVIDYVADFGRGWNLLEGFKQPQMKRRLAWAAGTMAVICLLALIFPRHSGTFLARLFMSSAHYPTRTTIEKIIVNGQVVPLSGGGFASVKCPYGEPLRLQLIGSGELPTDGRAKLRTVDGGLETEVKLVRGAASPEGASEASPMVTHVSATGNSPTPAATSTDKARSDSSLELAQGEVAFAGELSRLIDTLHYQVYLGDAWTEPATLEVIPLPQVEAQLSATPPKYARADSDDPAPRGSRQLSVIEGSQVDLEVVCQNKQLARAVVVIEGQEIALVNADQKGRRWTLPVEGTPLASVTKPVSYEIKVEDVDGMAPQRPVLGMIRIKTDRPPQIFGDVLTRQVLPTAKPNIELRASDDYGIARLVARVQVSRDGQESEEERVVTIRAPKQPVLRKDLPLRDTFAFDLKQFKLNKGDQVRVTLEAIDYRGQSEGRSGLSEPLVLNVTDESGILSAISESDERSAKQLDAIIRRQLGIGGSK